MNFASLDFENQTEMIWKYRSRTLFALKWIWMIIQSIKEICTAYFAMPNIMNILHFYDIGSVHISTKRWYDMYKL